MLVAVGDRQMRIELGSGYGNAYDAQMQEVINEHMLPKFKRDKYSEGIYNGSRALVAKLTGTWPEDTQEFAESTDSSGDRLDHQTHDRQTNNGTRRDENLFQFLNTLRITFIMFLWRVAPIVGLSFAGFHLYSKTQPRKCPECDGKMFLLGESVEDDTLDPGQKLEEELKSVNYNVWQCCKCFAVQTEREIHHNSKFSTCPSCNYRTMEVSHRTIRQPNYTTPGTKETTQSCRHCDHFSVETRIIPKLAKSHRGPGYYAAPSNRYGGDFGGADGNGGGASGDGGGSSGDGASGSW
jgi:uncharacterized protein